VPEREIAALTRFLGNRLTKPVAEDLAQWHISPYRDAFVFSHISIVRGGAFYLVRGEDVRPVYLARETLEDAYAAL
jgi:hypothetical protein